MSLVMLIQFVSLPSEWCIASKVRIDLYRVCVCVCVFSCSRVYRDSGIFHKYFLMVCGSCILRKSQNDEKADRRSCCTDTMSTGEFSTKFVAESCLIFYCFFFYHIAQGSVPFPQREHVYWRRRLQASLVRYTSTEFRRLILHCCDQDHVQHLLNIEFEKCTKRRRSEEGAEEKWENVSIFELCVGFYFLSVIISGF